MGEGEAGELSSKEEERERASSSSWSRRTMGSAVRNEGPRYGESELLSISCLRKKMKIYIKKKHLMLLHVKKNNANIGRPIYRLITN